MARYRLGIQTGAAANGTAYAQIRAGARQVKVREIRLVSSGGAVGQAGLIRSATLGTASAATAPQAHDPGNTSASTSLIETGWSLAPTIPGSPNYLQLAYIANVAGNGDIWTFPTDDPLIIAPGAGVLIWNNGAGAGPVMNVTLALDE